MIGKITLDLAAVRVLADTAENLFVQINVVDVHGTVEGECDHLWHVVGFDLAWNTGTISRAETIGQVALSWVALGGSVRVGFDGFVKARQKKNDQLAINQLAKKIGTKSRMILTAGILIRTILAVGFVVAEQSLFDTFSVTAR